MTGFTEWKAGEFTEWEISGTAFGGGGEIVLDYTTASEGTDPFNTGAYYGGNFYNAGSFKVGEVTSPELPAEINFSELIVSWNATTPTGSWVEVLARVNLGSHWTKWYNLGVWASDSSTIQRHSVKLQGDSDGYVAVDTLVLSDKKAVVEGYQIKVRLFSTDAASIPSVRLSFSGIFDVSAEENRSISRRSHQMGHSVTGARVFADGLSRWRQRMVQPNLGVHGARFPRGRYGPVRGAGAGSC